VANPCLSTRSLRGTGLTPCRRALTTERLRRSSRDLKLESKSMSKARPAASRRGSRATPSLWRPAQVFNGVALSRRGVGKSLSALRTFRLLICTPRTRSARSAGRLVGRTFDKATRHSGASQGWEPQAFDEEGRSTPTASGCPRRMTQHRTSPARGARAPGHSCGHRGRIDDTRQ
jgi:hypothetical protein